MESEQPSFATKIEEANYIAKSEVYEENPDGRAGNAFVRV